MPTTRTRKKISPKNPARASSPQEDTGNLRTYEFHGIHFSKREGNEHKGSCPFCNGKAFHVDEVEGFFNCKTCDKAGNKYTFLQLYYDYWFEKTTEKQLESLAKDRGIDAEAFEIAELAYDRDNQRWLIPHRNNKGSMVNLCVWSPKKLIDGKRPILGTAGCKAHLFNLESVGDSRKVYVCEGQWDAIALQWLLYKMKNKEAAVVSVPGATTFKEEWGEFFHGREVFFLYDNDETGVKGTDKATNILRKYGKCRHLSSITWPDSYPEKYDIRDLISSNLTKPKKAWDIIQKAMKDLILHTAKSTGVVCKDFKTLTKNFAEHVFLTDEMRDALLVICSVILSNKIFKNPFCPLWVFIVGPSGCGKTLLLQSTADMDTVSFQTVMTPKTLVSGYATKDGTDKSLLPDLIGNTLVIEDFTGVLSMAKTEQDEIHGVLRSCYNGRYEKSFGHIGLRVYPSPDSGHETCHFTALAGVTSEIHTDRRANHGERWLKFRMKPSEEDQQQQVEAAMQNTLNEVAPELELRRYMTAFLEHKLSEETALPEVSEQIRNRINGLGQIVSLVQAVVIRERGHLLVPPEVGIASRISQQLLKLGQAVAFVLGKKFIDEEVYRILQKCGFDTCYGMHSKVLTAVAQADPINGITRQEICQQQKIASKTCHEVLEELLELGGVEYDLAESEGPGQPARLWKITAHMRDLFGQAGIPLPDPSPSRKKRTSKKVNKVSPTKAALTRSTKSPKKKSKTVKKKTITRKKPTKKVRRRK